MQCTCGRVMAQEIEFWQEDRFLLGVLEARCPCGQSVRAQLPFEHQKLSAAEQKADLEKVAQQIQAGQGVQRSGLFSFWRGDRGFRNYLGKVGKRATV